MVDDDKEDDDDMDDVDVDYHFIKQQGFLHVKIESR